MASERQQHGDRAAAHARITLERCGEEPFIHRAQAIFHVIHECAGRGAFPDGRERLDDHAARHVAGIVSAHAGSHDPQAGCGQLQHGVLIM